MENDQGHAIGWKPWLVDLVVDVKRLKPQVRLFSHLLQHASNRWRHVSECMATIRVGDS